MGYKETIGKKILVQEGTVYQSDGKVIVLSVYLSVSRLVSRLVGQLVIISKIVSKKRRKECISSNWQGRNMSKKERSRRLYKYREMPRQQAMSKLHYLLWDTSVIPYTRLPISTNVVRRDRPRNDNLMAIYSNLTAI